MLLKISIHAKNIFKIKHLFLHIFIISLFVLSNYFSAITSKAYARITSSDHPCPGQAKEGNYDCEDGITLEDFDKWKGDFTVGNTSLSYFEYWRRAYFDALNGPTITSRPGEPTITSSFPEPSNTPAPATPTTGIFINRAAKFDGFSSLIQFTPTRYSLQSPFTVDVWIKPNPITPQYSAIFHPTIIGTVDGPENSPCQYGFSLLLLPQPNGQQFAVNLIIDASQRGVSFASSVMNYGSWTHVSFAIDDNNKVTLFINGKKLGGDPSISPGICDPGRGYTIGAQYDGLAPLSDSFYNGLVDQVRISNFIRYDSDFFPPRPPYSVDQNTISLLDFSTDDIQNGQIFGNVQFVDSPIP